MKDLRSGRPEPTTSFILPYEQTDGEIAVDLYELTGRTALEWQQGIIYDILAKNEDGKWTHTTFAFSVPRQNGKGEILIMRELYGLAIGERIMHTAHLTSTAHKAWERLCDILDMLGIPYRSIKAKGQEIIELTDGGRVEFRTRTNTGGLGETYDLLIIDEAQEYTTSQQSALKYVIAASANPQTIMTGTPPTPISSGTVFKTRRRDILAGERENSGWAEWSVDEFSDPNDKDLWYRTNPSLNLTELDERSIKDEISSDEDGVIDFNIQRLGLWIKYNQKSAILKSEWEALTAKQLPKFTGHFNVGIKYARDGETVSMAVAVRTEDDKIFTEVIGCKPVREGNDWIIAFLRRAKGKNRIVIDGAGSQEILAGELKAVKVKKVILPKVAEVKKANAAFMKNLYDDRIRHMTQPSLDHVVTNCEKRAIGTNGGFGFQAIRDQDDISIMDAVILAAWATDEFKEPHKQRAFY